MTRAMPLLFSLALTLACQAPTATAGLPRGQSPSIAPSSTAAPTLASAPLSVQRTEATHVAREIYEANYQILKLNYARAEELLKSEVGLHAAITRARLALYRADCEEARAHLSSSLVQNDKNAQDLINLAKTCFGATAGSSIVEDQDKGVWIRLQDQNDRVLAPLLIEVADRARMALERDLGETLPRPLRIDLVRDLFSLSAVSGLPVDAAETTGTVAVARWGRITMVSPRAMLYGFPWADTLAHEITHLLISRATAERAPLWLQEGIAKRQERRWRQAQLFDDGMSYERRAYDAQVAGRSVGVNKIGPSIAMLPSADAASIAFAEVTSFMEYWIEQNGPRSLPLLLRDLEVAPDSDSALQSVSGFNVNDWELLWRQDLSRRLSGSDNQLPTPTEDRLGPLALARRLRVVELLSVDGQPGMAAWQGTVDLDRAPHAAALRFLTARAALLDEDGEVDGAAIAHEESDARVHLGSLGDVDEAHAGWLALQAAQAGGDEDADARSLLDQAQALDPLLPEVACGGIPWVGLGTTLELNEDSPLPFDPKLCEAARKLPVRGSR